MLPQFEEIYQRDVAALKPDFFAANPVPKVAAIISTCEAPEDWLKKSFEAPKKKTYYSPATPKGQANKHKRPRRSDDVLDFDYESYARSRQRAPSLDESSDGDSNEEEDEEEEKEEIEEMETEGKAENSERAAKAVKKDREKLPQLAELPSGPPAKRKYVRKNPPAKKEAEEKSKKPRKSAKATAEDEEGEFTPPTIKKRANAKSRKAPSSPGRDQAAVAMTGLDGTEENPVTAPSKKQTSRGELKAKPAKEKTPKTKQRKEEAQRELSPQKQPANYLSQVNQMYAQYGGPYQMYYSNVYGAYGYSPYSQQQQQAGAIPSAISTSAPYSQPSYASQYIRPQYHAGQTNSTVNPATQTGSALPLSPNAEAKETTAEVSTSETTTPLDVQANHTGTSNPLSASGSQMSAQASLWYSHPSYAQSLNYMSYMQAMQQQLQSQRTQLPAQQQQTPAQQLQSPQIQSQLQSQQLQAQQQLHHQQLQQLYIQQQMQHQQLQASQAYQPQAQYLQQMQHPTSVLAASHTPTVPVTGPSTEASLQIIESTSVESPAQPDTAVADGVQIVQPENIENATMVVGNAS